MPSYQRYASSIWLIVSSSHAQTFVASSESRVPSNDRKCGKANILPHFHQHHFLESDNRKHLRRHASSSWNPLQVSIKLSHFYGICQQYDFSSERRRRDGWALGGKTIKCFYSKVPPDFVLSSHSKYWTRRRGGVTNQMTYESGKGYSFMPYRSASIISSFQRQPPWRGNAQPLHLLTICDS